MQQLLDRPLNQSIRRSARPAPVPPRNTLTPRIARVVGIDGRNRVMVEVTGFGGEVSTARLLKGIPRDDLLEQNGEGREVLVVFDGGCADRPIIVGLLEHEADEAATMVRRRTNSEPPSAHPPKERVLIEALAELVLKCGAGSITLREDGKIVLRGTHLLSRASGPIRIKGGHVEIN